ncbi:MAG: hypothetical protein QG622_1651, partial [Actinomycetota bacterium]|nr:hypothetical protein [Actinomycetota bacterium]
MGIVASGLVAAVAVPAQATGSLGAQWWP